MKRFNEKSSATLQRTKQPNTFYYALTFWAVMHRQTMYVKTAY